MRPIGYPVSMARRISHVIGIDDAPFPRQHRGNVRVVGAVFAGNRLEGVVSAQVRRDGANATAVLTRMVRDSRFFAHLQAVLLQGIALAGFNVVDIHGLSRALGLPVVVVVRRRPDWEAVRAALLARVPGGARKWRLIERAGPVEAAGGVFLQRAGIGSREAAQLVMRTCINGGVPEPLRTAHLIAGGVTTGESRGRV